MSRTRFAAALAALALVASPAPAFADTAYVYDSAGRLIKVTYSNGVSIEYRYDASGNRQVVTTARIPNRPPVAGANSGTILASTTYDIAVLGNDSDPDRDPLTITAVSTPTGGTATILSGAARIRYVAPATGGIYSFTYTISDGQGHTATATVTITVTSNNQPPVANADDAYTTTSNSVPIMVLSNDTDPNSNTLTVTAVGSPSGGSVSIGPGGGYVVYNSPVTAGTYSFTYTVSDGAGGSASATVTVYVEGVIEPPPGCDPRSNEQCDVE